MVEGFNSRFRDELLNSWRFDRLFEARVIIDDWGLDYSVNRPHSAHGDLTPTEFALQWTTTHSQGDISTGPPIGSLSHHLQPSSPQPRQLHGRPTPHRPARPSIMNPKATGPPVTPTPGQEALDPPSPGTGLRREADDGHGVGPF